MPAFILPACRLAMLCLVVVLVAACSTKQPVKTSGPPMFTPMYEKAAVRLTQQQADTLARKMSTQYQGLKSFSQLDFAVRQSISYASSRSGTAISLPGLNLSYSQLAQSLRHLQKILPRVDADPGILAREFTWYRIGPDFGFTGYYEPTLKASRKQSAAYPYPLYRKPPDLKKGVPYHSRNAIDRKGVLAGRGLEIAWVSSEADAFFLHIQGSGRLVFEDGSVSHVLYADKNNRAYVPIGRVMRDRGLLHPDNVNMKTIRECLLGNPEKCAELYDTNPSYIFFREASSGPYGSMGRVLTPYVSTATDRRTLPHGSLVFATVPMPDTAGKHNKAFYGITLPQDTGGAIKGNRIDLFCGPGPEAPHVAGHLNAKGAVYVLVKQ